MTYTETKQMRRVFPKGWEYQDIPSFIRARDERDIRDYWEPGEQDQDFDERENTEKEDIEKEREEAIEKAESEEEDLDQERLCQEAQDEAIAESNYQDRALEAGKEEGREIGRSMFEHFRV